MTTTDKLAAALRGMIYLKEGGDIQQELSIYRESKEALRQYEAEQKHDMQAMVEAVADRVIKHIRISDCSCGKVGKEYCATIDDDAENCATPTARKEALDALERLLEDALGNRDGDYDSEKDAETIRAALTEQHNVSDNEVKAAYEILKSAVPAILRPSLETLKNAASREQPNVREDVRLAERRAAAATLAAWRMDEATDAQLCNHVMFILDWLNPYPERAATAKKGGE